MLTGGSCVKISSRNVKHENTRVTASVSEVVLSTYKVLLSRPVRCNSAAVSVVFLAIEVRDGIPQTYSK
jgi:hypothetical protein